jgi:hypothetical protein
VIVTTHSPLVLNFLPDPVARQAVIQLFRNPLGHTKAVRLFDLPSAERRLRLLGPGEVFVDLDLHELPAEAGMLQGGAQQGGCGCPATAPPTWAPCAPARPAWTMCPARWP